MNDLFHSKKKKKAQAELDAFYAYWRRLREEASQNKGLNMILKDILNPADHYDSFLESCDDIKEIALSKGEGAFVEYHFESGQVVTHTPDAVELNEDDDLTDEVAAYMVATAIASGMQVLSFSGCSPQERVSFEKAATAANIAFANVDGGVVYPVRKESIDTEVEAKVLPEVEPSKAEKLHFFATADNSDYKYSYTYTCDTMNAVDENKEEITQADTPCPPDSTILFQCSGTAWHRSTTPGSSYQPV